MKSAVFIDRDGTLNEEVHYLSRPDQLRLISGAAQAIVEINRAGLLAVVITNQAGVARGLIPEDQLPRIQQAFTEMLGREGARIDGYYQCPHHPDGSIARYRRTCTCRKPQPGLLLQAAQELDIDLKKSCVVGDKASDIQLGHNVGATTFMVMTGYGRDHHNNYPPDCRPPHYTCSDILEAAQLIIQREKDVKREA
ncbi:MAG: HAD family hydrolase [Deltaproteobacteria bacterium]|nr:HAD family hydrolase [Deltaproteobacteria bacterium]